MKVFTLLLSLALVSCSSSSKKDADSFNESEGQFSNADGAPLIYYKEGSLIVIKSCNNAKDLDIKNPKIAREKCVGKENRVTAELFRQILTKVIADKAAEEAKKAASAAASAGGAPAAGAAPAAPGKSAAEKLEEAKIEKQLEFIEAYNLDGSAMKDLRATSIKGVFNQKLKSHLDKTVDALVNDSSSGSKASSDPDGILYSVLKELDPNKKKPCGLRGGSLSDRIKDCSSTPGSSLDGWKLVMRTKSNREIWQEVSSGLVWGELLTDSYDHIDAVGQCSRSRDENGEFESSEFRLPTIAEFEKSQLSSGNNPLYQKSYKFWSSNSEGPEVWVYNGNTGKKELVPRSVITKNKDGGEFSSPQKLNARCVAKIK